MVFQHFSLFETLTVAENIALALEPSQSAADAAGAHSRGFRQIRAAARSAPARPQHVGGRAAAGRDRALPAAGAAAADHGRADVRADAASRRQLFETLRRLAGEGCSILYISHKLDEIRALCDRATVLRARPGQRRLRSAQRVVIVACADDDRRRPAASTTPRGARGRRRLVVSGLSLPSDDPFGTIAVENRASRAAGEIVGIAGVSGNGQKELMAAISGERPLAERRR